jgi:hypothetical protein
LSIAKIKNMDAVGAAYASNEGREPLFDFDRLGIAHDEIVAVWSEGPVSYIRASFIGLGLGVKGMGIGLHVTNFRPCSPMIGDRTSVRSRRIVDPCPFHGYDLVQGAKQTTAASLKNH